ncbi:MAG: lantibiotic dehydratase [Chitinophagaceae bacterium]
MKKYNFFSSLFVRTPLYSLGQHKSADYPFILNTYEFKLALLLASTAFFNELKRKQFDYELLSEKQKHTVRKYINRASFRSTPFGLFSSFSLVNWTEELQTNILLADPNPCIKLDFTILHLLWEKYLKHKIQKSTKFQLNQSFYFSKTDFRYIKTEIKENKETLFSMVSISKNTILKKILKFCMTGKSYEEILSLLTEDSGANMQEVDSFMIELINQQIIVSHSAPSVTGEDYTDLIIKYLDDCNEAADLKINLKKLSVNSSDKLCHLLNITNELDKYLLGNVNTNYFYSIAERKVTNGGLSSKYYEQIQDGLYCLNLLSKVAVNSDLNKFKLAFKRKYESGEVPLLEVLDTQFGIGYGNFDKIKNNYGLSDYNTSSKKDDLIKVEEDFMKSLLKKWQLKNSYNSGYELEITEEHLKNLKTADNNEGLPPSISVIFRLIEEKVFIEDAGGASALSLMGRFSYSKEVYEFGKQIAEQEQKLNKDVIFAEVAHICNLHSANINRRKHLRNYEIPVLTNSTIDTNRKINLSDIMVSVNDNNVKLRSKNLNKVIIPRLSSAFNYTKSSLPVFRFFCDVQSQHLKLNFSFSLASHVPGLRFYPRITYKACILQIAEWHLEASELDFLQEKDPCAVLELFRVFAKEINLPRYFAYTIHDNFLVYDSEKSDDIIFFLKEIRGKGKILLKEFPFIEQNNLVKDKFHRPLMAQYIASMYLNAETYKIEKQFKAEKKHSALIKNTKEWIYFKIYCHPLSSDIILCDYLIPLVNKYIKNGNIKQWFWVRYNDPEYHIRFRIKPCQKMRTSLFEGFTTCLNNLNLNKLINRFQPDIYKQEINRYSSYLIADVETIFTTSSTIIGNFLKVKYSSNYNDEKVIIEAALSISEILLAFEFSNTDSVQFCKFQFDEFFSEFGSPKLLRPEMENLYKRLKHDLSSIVTCCEKRNSYTFLKKDILNLTQNFNAKKVECTTLPKLVTDIIHMHLNRLYFDNQRYLEMVTYYLVYRCLNAEIHKGYILISEPF